MNTLTKTLLRISLPLALLVLLLGGLFAPAQTGMAANSSSTTIFTGRLTGHPFNTGQGVAMLVDQGSGGQTITLGYMITRDLSSFGYEIGDRYGQSILVDANGIWGTDGVLTPAPTTAVDLMVSAMVKPDSLFALLADGTVAELVIGWDPDFGTFDNPLAGFDNPLAGFNNPTSWTPHGPFWDVEQYGAPVTFYESVRPFADPDIPFGDPILVIGTDNGHLAMLGRDLVPADGGGWELADDLVLLWGPIPAAGFDNPLAGFDNPLAGFDNPLAGLPVQDLTAVRRPGGFDLAYIEGGHVLGFDPGVRAANGHAGTVPSRSLFFNTTDLGADLIGLAGVRLHPDTYQDIMIPGGANFYEDRFTVIDGGTTLEILAVNTASYEVPPFMAFPEAFKSFEYDLGLSLKSIETGSLWGVTADGQSTVYVPEYNPLAEDNPLGDEGLHVVAGLPAVDLGPRGFNLSANGKWVTAVIEMGANGVADIDADSLTLSVLEVEGSEMAPANSFKGSLADKDGDGNLELVVKFDRSELAGFLALVEGGSATLVLEWDYTDLCTESDPCRGVYAQHVKILP